MEGKGPRHERETIINFNEEEETASIWTASESVYRKLLKRGYAPSEDSERHAVFTMLKRDIKLPRPKRQLSEAQREQAVLRMKQARKGKPGADQGVDSQATIDGAGSQ